MKSPDNEPADNKFHGIPFDWRRPTLARFKSRWWNPTDNRLFTPKVYGAGWDINLYWFCHPLRFIQRRREQ
jgi:hypothetical protein